MQRLSASLRTALVLATLLVIVVCVGSYERAQRERARISQDLMNVGIAAPAASSTAALKLLWYEAVNRIDPVFAIDGTDPQKLEAAVALLQKKKSEMYPRYDASDARIIDSSLYPNEFLAALPQLQRARADFFAAPSLSSASAYQAQLIQTITAYETGVTQLERALRSTPATKGVYLFLGATTDRATFYTALESLRASAERLRTASLQRYSCLRYFASSCQTLSALLAQRAESIAIPAPVAPPGREAFDRDKVVTAFNKHILPLPSEDRSLPPLIAQQDQCYGHDEQYVRVWWERLNEGVDAYKSSITEDIYFNIVTPARNPLYAAEYDLGSRLKYQISGHFYMCPNSGYEWAVQNGALSAREIILKVHPLAASGMEPAASLEKKIASASYIDLHDMGTYVQAAAQIVREQGYERLGEQLGAERAEALDEIIARWQQGSARFDEAVNELAFESEYISIVEPLKLFALLFTRSYASALFLAGNASVHAEPISFTRNRAIFPPSFFQLASYNELTRAGSTTQELIDAVWLSAEVGAQLTASGTKPFR